MGCEDWPNHGQRKISARSMPQRFPMLGTLPEVPSGFTERLRASLDAANKAEATQKRACDDEARARRDHAAITVDNAIIAEAGNVLSLFSEIGAYTNDRRDSPRIQAEADDYRDRLVEITTRLGITDSAAVEKDRIPALYLLKSA